MTDQKKIDQRSKKLSWLLRHGGYKEGLNMDAAGWVDVDEVLEKVEMSRVELEIVVHTNQKQRIQLEGDRVRCCQGHSTKNRHVTQEALEASWDRYEGEQIWHGTTMENLSIIAQEGLKPMRRTHVHCAPAPDSRVGKRANTPVMLRLSPRELRAAGLGIFEASNGVILIREAPPHAVVDLIALSRRAKSHLPALRKKFGLR